MNTISYTRRLIFTSAFLGQAVVLWLCLSEAWLAAFLLHAGIVSLAAGFLGGQGGRDLLFLVLLAFLGPAGLLVWLAGHLTGRVFAPALQQPFHLWLEQFLDEEKPSEHLYRRLQAGQEDMSEKAMVQPFQHVMLYGSTSQKRHVLGHLISHYSCAFAPVLKIALQDEDNAVRVYAATTLARIEQRYTQQILAMSSKQRQHPGNPYYKLELALLYDDYAYCGVIDRQRMREMQEKAAALLEDCLRGGKEQLSGTLQERILRNLGRLYVRMSQPEKATALLAPVVNTATETMPASILLWYWESLFRSGRLEDLRRACKASRHLLTRESLHYHRAVDLLACWVPEQKAVS
jgi:tetratricopeptide (TPR) repeat protein